MSPTLKLIALSIAFLASRQNATAQLSADSLSPVVFSSMKYKDIHSGNVGDKLRIYFSFPPGYDTAAGKFPVLYLTDGDWNLHPAVSCFNYLRQDYITREALIVAIGYGEGKNQRSRDLDPANSADKFLAFIAKELIPYVEQHFKASQERTLYGYSLGGAFATYAMFRQPALFHTVLIGAPGGAGTTLMPEAENYFRSHTTLQPRIFVGTGSFEPETVRNIERFEKYLRARKIPPSQLETIVSPGLGHGAAVPAVMQNAVRFAFCRRFRPVKLNARQLSGYAGTYEIADAPGKTFRIVYEADRLLLLLNGVGKDTLAYQLIPASDTSVFMKEVPDKLIVFPRKTAGPNHYLKVIMKDNTSLTYKKLSGR